MTVVSTRAASVVSLSGLYATGRTVPSGAIFCAPSTITLSPGRSPFSMIHCVPCQAVAATLRALTLLLSARTYTKGPPSPCCTARCGTRMASLRLRPRRWTLTN